MIFRWRLSVDEKYAGVRLRTFIAVRRREMMRLGEAGRESGNVHLGQANILVIQTIEMAGLEKIEIRTSNKISQVFRSATQQGNHL
ncbi:hypothetical protein AAC387_Pa01g4411 [Persea americana]